MKVTHPIEPVYDGNSKILVLGTMPSPASRDAGFYYMHPQNRFWQVMARVTGETLQYKNNGQFTVANGRAGELISTNVDVPASDIDAAISERRSLVLRHGIALWDVLASCDITGAADSSIKNAVPNDIASLLQQTQITRIFTTGQTAYKYYTCLVERHTHISAVCLPSTSPANAKWTLELLVEKYKSELGIFL